MFRKIVEWWYRRKNVLFIDRKRKVIVVRRLDGGTMMLRQNGWKVIEAGELRFMTLDVTSTAVRSRPASAAGDQ